MLDGWASVVKFLSEQSHKCVKFIHLITFISRTHYTGIYYWSVFHLQMKTTPQNLWSSLESDRFGGFLKCWIPKWGFDTKSWSPMTWVILGVPPPSWSPQSLGTPEVCGWTSSQRLGGGDISGYQGPLIWPGCLGCQAVGDKLLDVYMPMPFATQPDISAANIGTFGRCWAWPRSLIWVLRFTSVYRSMSKHGVLTNPVLCMALPSFSFHSFSTL